MDPVEERTGRLGRRSAASPRFSAPSSGAGAPSLAAPSGPLESEPPAAALEAAAPPLERLPETGWAWGAWPGSVRKAGSPPEIKEGVVKWRSLAPCSH